MSEKTFKINGIELEQLDVSAFETSYTGLKIIEINNKGTVSEVWRKAYPCEITVDSEYLSQITINHNGTETSVSSGTATIYIPINSTSSTSANVLTITCENGDTYTLTAVAKNSDSDYKYYFDTWVTLGEFGRESCSISTTGHKTEIPYITITFTNAEGSSWSEASYTVKSGSVINDAGSWEFSVTDIRGQVYTNTFTRGSSDNYYVYDQNNATVEIVSEANVAWPYTAITDTVIYGNTPRDPRTYTITLDGSSNSAPSEFDNTDAPTTVENPIFNIVNGSSISCVAQDIIKLVKQDSPGENRSSIYINGTEVAYALINVDYNLLNVANYYFENNTSQTLLADVESGEIEMSLGEFRDQHSSWFSSYSLSIKARFAQSSQWEVIYSNSNSDQKETSGDTIIVDTKGMEKAVAHTATSRPFYAVVHIYKKGTFSIWSYNARRWLCQSQTDATAGNYNSWTKDSLTASLADGDVKEYNLKVVGSTNRKWLHKYIFQRTY